MLHWIRATTRDDVDSDPRRTGGALKGHSLATQFVKVGFE